MNTMLTLLNRISPKFHAITVFGLELPLSSGHKMLLFILLLTIGVSYLSVLMVRLYNEDFQVKFMIKEFIRKLGYLIIILVMILVAELGDLGLMSISDILDFYYLKNGLMVIGVCVWVILTELVSTLKTVSEMGLPLPSFLFKIIETKWFKLIETEIKEKVDEFSIDTFPVEEFSDDKKPIE